MWSKGTKFNYSQTKLVHFVGKKKSVDLFEKNSIIPQNKAAHFFEKKNSRRT